MSEMTFTYDELATALNRTPDATRQLVRRRRWKRVGGNDGKTRVVVPVEELDPLRNPVVPATPVEPEAPTSPVHSPNVAPDMTGHIKWLEEAVEALRQERDQERIFRLEAERDRDRALTAERLLMVETGVLKAVLDFEKQRVAAADDRLTELKAERDRWAEQASRSWWKRLVG